MKRVLAAIISLFVDVTPVKAKPQWALARHEYKGFPLFLRYAVGLNYDVLQAKYPFRVVVTLKFAQSLDNGLPEAHYNRTLEEFDEFVIHELSSEHAQCVLVETFGGKRAFYAYAANEALASALRAKVMRRYSRHAVTVEIESDPNWSLIRNYAAEYFPAHGTTQKDG